MNGSPWPYGIIDLDLDRLEAMLSFAFLGSFDDRCHELEARVEHPGKRDYLKLLKAKWLQQKGKFSEAQPLLKELHDAHPENERVMCDLGLCLFNCGEYEEARGVLQAVHHEVEWRSAAMSVLGSIKRVTGELCAAGELLKEALALDPLNVRAVEELAQCALESGDIPETYPYIERYLSAEPFDVPVRLWAVMLLSKLGQKDDARDHLAIAKVIQPKSSRIEEIERTFGLA